MATLVWSTRNRQVYKFHKINTRQIRSNSNVVATTSDFASKLNSSRHSDQVPGQVPNPTMSVSNVPSLSRRKKKQREIAIASCRPSAERGFRDFEELKHRQDLADFYIAMRRSRTQNAVFFLESRDGSYGINSNADEDLIRRLSNLQAHDEDDYEADETTRRDKFANEKPPPQPLAIQFEPQGNVDIGSLPKIPKIPKVSHQGTGHWPVRLKKNSANAKTKPEDLQKAFNELFVKLDLAFDEARAIIVSTPITSISYKDKDLFKRAIFQTAITKGGVRVVDGAFPPEAPLFRLTTVDNPKSKEARPYNTTTDEYVYIRARRMYWTLRGGAPGDGYLLPEIPYSAVTLPFRSGYHCHLENERLTDEDDPDPLIRNEHSLGRARSRLRLVEQWVNEDPDGTYTSLQEFMAEQNVVQNVMSDFSISTPMSTPGRISESNDERVESPTLNKIVQSSGAPAADSSLEILDLADLDAVPKKTQSSALNEQALDHLIQRNYKDEPYSQQAWEWQSEVAKIQPDLKVCRKCGDSNHRTAKCSRARQEEEGREENNYFQPAAASLAALQKQGYRCPYSYCREGESHIIKACPGLHQRCETCRCRGHDSKTYPGEGGVFYTQCPQVAELLNIKNPNTASSPSFSQLIAEFEKHADSGMMTKWRYHVAATGFYPVWGEGDVPMLGAIGYRWLNNLETNIALTLLKNINELCSAAFTVGGIKGLQFQVIPDRDWTAIWKARKDLSDRRKEERKREDGPKPAKQPRTFSPPPGHSGGPPRPSPSYGSYGSYPPYGHRPPGQSRSRSPPPANRRPLHRHSPHAVPLRNPSTMEFQDGHRTMIHDGRNRNRRGEYHPGHHAQFTDDRRRN